MASRPIIAGRASALPAPLPLALIAQAIPRLSRHDLEALTERLIDRLDELDPDPDLEDGDSDYCLASDDRGTSGPNARFPGYVAHKEIEGDADCEAPRQPPVWTETLPQGR